MTLAFTAKSLPHGAVLASLPGGFRPGGAASTDANGQPRRRYVKDLIRVGDFVKADSAGEQQIKIDQVRLSHWAEMVKQLVADGNPIPVTSGHDMTGDPDKARGFLLGAFVEGDTLYGDIELVGQKAIESASTAHVSIYSPPSFKDGSGRTYEWPIRHVALTTDPVINGQKPFIPIAASRDAKPDEVPVFQLSTESDMDLKKLQAALGITTDLTAANAEQAIVAAFDAAKKSASPDTAKLQADLAAANTENASLKKQVVELKPISLSADVRGVLEEAVDAKIGMLVDTARIAPGVGKLLKPILCGSALMLSREANGGQQSRAMALLDALKDNNPADFTPKTGEQYLALSRQSEGTNAIDPDLKARQERARRLAGHTAAA